MRQALTFLFIAAPIFAASLTGIPGMAWGDMVTGDTCRANIGYVDFKRALNEVHDGRQAKRRLKDEFKERQQRLDNLQSELMNLKDEIDRDRLVLPPEELEKKEKAYRRMFFELKQKFSAFKTEMAAKESHLTSEILERLRRLVLDVGRREGYDLILEKSQDVVLYSPDGSDITDRVIREYNRKQKRRGR
jgi:outer membrane protein